jgi:Zn-dependent peptidase ImmA (M78 family)
MAPDGHLWFHPRGQCWRPDFSVAPPGSQRLFIHEMVHVWQHQSGIDLRFRRPPFARYRYLPLKPGRPFHRYGIEQQAEIVADAFLLARGLRLPDHPPLSAYQALIPFWPMPADARPTLV